MIVKTQKIKFPELKLASGSTLSPVTIAYETYGELNSKKDNAILVIHALTGTAHCAGKNHESDEKPGWWDEMIGPGKHIDTDKYFVVSSNCLGGCSGTTGPRSINPKTGKRYNLDFPQFEFGDQVELQKMMMKSLNIDCWLSVIGGSMGGMNALEWALKYPKLLKTVIPIATTWQLSSQSIAFNWVGRKAIMSDQGWKNGEYEDGLPDQGLAIARMLAHITYLSDTSMDMKFGRNLQNNDKSEQDFSTRFSIESYLNYQGNRFVERFDANCYLYLTRALDYFNLADHGNGDLSKAFLKAEADFLIVSFSSDWLFTTKKAKEMVEALKEAQRTVTFSEIESDYGHDSFLLEVEKLGLLIENFLAAKHQGLN
ncbi:MAG: homoserine O-acetyltransferase [Lentisphaeria bacterium]|nr:homoserine O-acetyltransferase [Lentisphaeria bacterium]